jgi:hypothetical protein
MTVSGSAGAECTWAERPGLGRLGPEQQALHLRAIEAIAGDTRRSVDEILPLYAEVLDALLDAARIADYLPVFASRRVRALLVRES